MSKETTGEWLRDSSLLYRLNDDVRPTNCDEINITMANGSREPLARADAAARLLTLIEADPELRRGDAAMTVAQWQKRHPDEEAGKWQNTDEFDAKWWRDNSRAWEVRSLIATEDAQAALAVKDAKRYRCVRSNPAMLLHLSNEEFDSAIDAAIAKEKSK